MNRPSTDMYIFAPTLIHILDYKIPDRSRPTVRIGEKIILVPVYLRIIVPKFEVDYL